MADNNHYLGPKQGKQDASARFESDSQMFSKTSPEIANPADFLVQTLETEILPRLMLVHQSHDAREDKFTAPTVEIGPEHVQDLVKLLLDQSVSSGNGIIEKALDDGVALETLYMDLLAPAARLMGELWEADARDFSDVTIGLCRLHELLRMHRLEAPGYESAIDPNSNSILLTTACGDQHVFGVIMVAEFFRKAGWLVNIEPGTTLSEMKRIVSKQHYDVLGLSLARDLSVEDIAREISTLRRASKNKNLKVIIGGASVQRNISIVNEFGADGYATDASKAPDTAKSLLADTTLSLSRPS